MTSERGQGTLEYLLVLVAVVLAIFYAVRPGGPVQSAVGGLLSTSGETLQHAVTESRGRIGL
ncbi:MAG: class III signal peptide-containing protein [Candidatus Omnitrophica bacterium]|nr:class III signal peptide-containing protein [Candidatus Omnitrophota bacterium]MBI3020780.1 class III signal peptide-containing protein [Candidatus Omnitrophota bacterium]MBI3083704.1 class III signal peptide-containing protein [Candidatus Omnitrophota bacterium]